MNFPVRKMDKESLETVLSRITNDVMFAQKKLKKKNNYYDRA